MSGGEAEAGAGGEAARHSPTRRAIQWLLGVQIALALMLVSGDFLEVSAHLLPGERRPGTETPVRPGDQTRRFGPGFLPGPPAGFPGDVPSRLTWQTVTTDDGDALLLTGQIEPGDAARFLDHLDDRARPPATVTLHSPGGSVIDALEIGRRLRADGIATRVGPDAACLSACPYILAGGTIRTVSRRGLVGVHQHYFGENVVLPAFLAVADIQRGQAEVMEYLDAVGVSPLLMAEAMRTPPQDIYVLVESELEGFALATAIID